MEKSIQPPTVGQYVTQAKELLQKLAATKKPSKQTELRVQLSQLEIQVLNYQTLYRVPGALDMYHHQIQSHGTR